jgi:hypothetical protein
MPGWGIAAAAALLGRVRNADPTLPALSSTNDPYPFIRADLGHVAERLGEPGREVSISEIIDLLKQLLAQSDPEHPLLSQAPAHAQVDDPGKARGDGQ